MTIKLEIDKNFVTIGEALSYTLTIHNTSPIPIHDVQIINHWSGEIEMVEASIDGIMPVTVNTNDIWVGALMEDEIKTLGIKGVVKACPTTNPVVQIIDGSYRTNIGASKEYVMSNAVVMLINDPCILPQTSFTLVAHEEMIQQDGTIQYNIQCTNKGNTVAEQLVLTNLVPEGTRLIVDSVYATDWNELIGEELFIGDLAIGQSKQITYMVQHDATLASYEIMHQVGLTYTFTLQDRRQVTRVYKSPIAYTKVCVATFAPTLGGCVKHVSQNTCSIDEELIYTLTLTNLGNTTATNIYLKDQIPKGSMYIPDTLIIGGQSVNYIEALASGITMQDIHPGERVQMIYHVKTNEIIEGNYIEGKEAILTYQYAVGDTLVTAEDYSTTTATQIGGAIFEQQNCVLTPKQEAVGIDDQVPYGLHIRNTGNKVATGLYIQLNLPEGCDILGEGWYRKGTLAERIYNKELLPDQWEEIPFVVNVSSLTKTTTLLIPCYIHYQYTVGDKLYTKSLEVVQTLPVAIKIAPMSAQAGELKVVNKNYARIGDQLTYTIRLENKGNTKAIAIQLEEQVPEEIKILTTPILEWGDLEVGECKEMSYTAEIIALPKENPINPQSKITYTYEAHSIKQVETYCMDATTYIYEARLTQLEGGIVKEVNQTLATIGDTVHYTLTLTNTGNIEAKQVKVQICTTHRFEQGNQSQYIEIGDILPSQSRTITYDIPIETIPQDQCIEVIDLIDYAFQVGEEWVHEEVSSQEIQTIIEAATFTSRGAHLIYEVDKSIAKIGDRLNYQLKITNQGNKPAYHVNLVLPTLEGCSWLVEEPLMIACIEPQEEGIFTYTLQLEALSTLGKVLCEPILYYNYTLSNQQTYSKEERVYGNEVRIRYAQMEGIGGTLIGEILPHYATINEEITYTLVLMNTGNVTIEYAVFQTQLPESFVLLPYTIQINEESIDGEGTLESIVLPPIAPGQQVILTYKVQVVDVPEEVSLTLPGKITYQYQVSELEQPEEVTVEIPSEMLYVHLAALSIEKQLDKIEVIDGETVNYQLICKNQGNTSAEVVTIKQTLPKGMVLANSKNQEGTIELGTILPGEEKETTFEVKIVSSDEEVLIDSTNVSYAMSVDPKTAPYKMEVQPIDTTFYIRHPHIVSYSAEEQQVGILGEKINYKFEVANEGNLPLANIKVILIIPQELQRCEDGIKVGDRPYRENNQEKDTISIDQIEVGDRVAIQVEFMVLKKSTNRVAVRHDVQYQFLLRGEWQTENISGIQTLVKIEQMDLKVLQKSDKEGNKVDQGDTIYYTLQLTNTGTIGIAQSLLYLTLPQETQLVGEAIQVGDKSVCKYDLKKGIPIDGLKPNEVLLVTYSVNVVAYGQTALCNKAYVVYSIKGIGEILITRQTSLDIHETQYVTLKQVTYPYQHTLTLPYQYPDIDEVVEVEVQVKVGQDKWLMACEDILQLRGQLQYKVGYRGTDRQIHHMTWVKRFAEKVQLMNKIEAPIHLKEHIYKQYIDKINKREIDTRILLNIQEQ